MRFIADYIIDSALCLPKSAASITISGPADAYSLVLDNAEESPHAEEGALRARLIFQHVALERARKAADDIFARILNS